MPRIAIPKREDAPTESKPILDNVDKVLGFVPIRLAAGIHCGEVVQGDVGSDKRLEFTVVGDTVNIASRVEAYCRVLNATVLVTGDFMQSLLAEGSFDIAKAFTNEGKHLLRGCKEPIQLYSLKAG
jgi:class 3 adenylate cyclase